MDRSRPKETKKIELTPKKIQAQFKNKKTPSV